VATPPVADVGVKAPVPVADVGIQAPVPVADVGIHGHAPAADVDSKGQVGLGVEEKSHIKTKSFQPLSGTRANSFA